MKFPCPHCGEQVEESAAFCRHCGSDADTGWNPDSDYESLELPDEPEPADPRPVRKLHPTKARALVVSFFLACAITVVALFPANRTVLVSAFFMVCFVLVLAKLAFPLPPHDGTGDDVP